MESPAATSVNSTNVRSLSLAENALRGAFRLLGPALPGPAAQAAEALFFTPPRSNPSAPTRRFLATGKRVPLPAAGGSVVTWSWGEGPTVLLVHGWGGVGGQLASFVAPLVEAGFTARTFDAPGHGASDGRWSSLVEIAHSLEAIAGRFGAPHAVIAHSLGAAATALALHHGFTSQRAVFIGPPSSPVEWTEQFAQRYAIAPRILAAMQERAERRLGFRWSELDVTALAAGRRTPLLVIHDRDDREVAWSEGAAIARAWPGADLLTTTGLGHRRILREPAVLSAATAFATQGIRDAARRPTPSAALESYLYDRDARGAASW